MPEKACAATTRARSTAAWGGQTERTTWLAATTAASPFMSSSPAAAARSRVWGLRPSEAQSTRRPLARAEAPTMLPMSPGCRRPIVELAMVRLSLGFVDRCSRGVAGRPRQGIVRNQAPHCSPFGWRGRASRKLFSQPPDLLGRPPARPLGRHVGEARRGAFGRLELDEIEDLEAAGAKEPDPLACGQGELH